MEKFRKFHLQNIERQIDYTAIKNYNHLKKYLITDSELKIKAFTKIISIDDIKIEEIKLSLFLMYFETDDQYIYHIDKIINNNGKFMIHKSYKKYNYVHANKNCKLSLLDTRTTESITHYNEVVHGNICQALEQTKHLDGDYIEIGVYRGGSALTALNYMKYANIVRKTYLFDTFDGFDYKEATNSTETHWEKNNNHHKLWGVKRTMKKLNNLLNSKCPNQDFELIQLNICRDELPERIKKIVVANIDVDILEATQDALNKISKKMVKGGIIIAEDATSTPGLIGAFYAMEKFLETSEGKKYIKLHLIGQYFLIKMN